MKKAFVGFLVIGFFFGFAATKHLQKKQPTAKTQSKESAVNNFDFLYGQWELLNAQSLKARKPSSLDEQSTNIVLEDDVYVDSGAIKANSSCDSGVEFDRYSPGKHNAMIKQARDLPLLKSYFADGKRSGIWTGDVVCKQTKKPLWSAILLTRRQLFLVSDSHVAELLRRDSVAPIHQSFTDSDSEVSTE